MNADSGASPGESPPEWTCYYRQPYEAVGHERCRSPGGDLLREILWNMFKKLLVVGLALVGTEMVVIGLVALDLARHRRLNFG